MDHRISDEDREFRRAFEACEIPKGQFDHRGHVRLAYIYLCEMSVESAVTTLRAALYRYIDHLGSDRAKYHETITRAWFLAVRHFMARATTPYASAAEFLNANQRLLDSKIMLTHYTTETLFSPQARAGFVEPDLMAIPHYT